MLNFIMVLVGRVGLGYACLFLEMIGLFLMVAIVGAIIIAMLMSLQTKQEKLEEKLDRLLREESLTESE